jgi:hypothetical protein
LVRAEAAVVPIAALLLAATQREFRARSFIVAASFCLVPYLAVGITSPAEIVARLRGGAAPTEDVPLNGLTDSQTQAIYRSDDIERLQSIGRKDPARSSRFHGLTAAGREFANEMIQAFGYLLLPLVIVGFIAKRRGELQDIEKLLFFAVGVQLMVTFVVAWRGGYLSTRHFVLPVVLTLPYAAYGLSESCRRLAASRWNRFGILDLKLEMVGTAAFVGVSLILTARPLHESQRPHRLAAEWLNSADVSPGAVLDQQGFTGLYTGRATYRFEAAATAFNDATHVYTVVERQDLEADTERGATLRYLLGGSEEAVARFAADDGKSRREVLIFPFRAAASPAYRKVTNAR